MIVKNAKELLKRKARERRALMRKMRRRIYRKWAIEKDLRDHA